MRTGVNNGGPVRIIPWRMEYGKSGTGCGGKILRRGFQRQQDVPGTRIWNGNRDGNRDKYADGRKCIGGVSGYLGTKSGTDLL